MTTKDSERPCALVTGASGGIGLELARVFAANKFSLMLLARNRDKLHALARELADFGDNVAAAGVIDCVGRAEFARKLEPAVMDVNGDDRVAARDLRRHQRREADRTDSEYREGIPRPRLHAVEHGARAGLSAACERPDQIERRILSHLHDEALVGERVSRE